jgi:hypothetical protein
VDRLEAREPLASSSRTGTGRYGIMYGMEKTTVYLTPELRRALRETARRRRVSEAELIRQGVAAVTAEEPAPRPRVPLFESGDPTLAARVDELLEGFGRT